MRNLARFLWRPAVAFWGTIGVIVLYVLSAGPAVSLLYHLHLPRWAAVGIYFFFLPLVEAVNKSELLVAAFDSYLGLWLDADIDPANLHVPMPDAPPFFTEVSGTIVAAWLIWNLVRWVQWNTSRSAPAPKTAPSPAES